MSQNIKLASNYSRDSAFLEFTTEKNNIMVGNTQPFGSVTIDQTKKGVNYPNVQSAVDDMAAMFTLPVGSVHICTDGISPAGVSQNDEFKFSGIVKVEGKNTGDTVNFDFYGFHVEVLVGDTGEEVASKVKRALDIAVSNNYVISAVNFGAILDILQVRYIDTQPHHLEKVIQIGITVVPSITSPARAGYGAWSLLGNQTIPLSGGSSNGAQVMLHYFRREN